MNVTKQGTHKHVAVTPVHKATVMKKVRENGIWSGYIAPCNVSSSHINGGWHIGLELTIELTHEGEMLVVSYVGGEHTPLDTFLSTYKYYNCGTHELGRRIRFWEDA